MKTRRLKIAMIGAGSISFCPATIADILLSERLKELEMEIALMDIDKRALEVSASFTRKAMEASGRSVRILDTPELDRALDGADFVITAIEVERSHYWSMDFHIPRRFGFRQVNGENGGPGGMFHALRNMGPILHIARRMEVLCPNAWLINYTNPEAKLVEAASKLTSIRTVGVCHGFSMGVEQIARILEMPEESLEIKGHGLNHFGWMTSIREKETGRNLYPEFRRKERETHWLTGWDKFALPRIMLRTYGLWPYPGGNHIGEYIAWSDGLLTSPNVQYFFDPVAEKPWETHQPPKYTCSSCSDSESFRFYASENDREDRYEEHFALGEGRLEASGEYGIPIIEGIVFDLKTVIPSLNMLNNGQMPGVMDRMCVEGPCLADADGVHPVAVEYELPTAINAMINHQGAIHRLLIEAYEEKSRNKLLEAVLLDPTISCYHNAVEMIDEMFRMQKALLPEMSWR